MSIRLIVHVCDVSLIDDDGVGAGFRIDFHLRDIGVCAEVTAVEVVSMGGVAVFVNFTSQADLALNSAPTNEVSRILVLIMSLKNYSLPICLSDNTFLPDPLAFIIELHWIFPVV